MKCPYCNSETPDRSVFCGTCGKMVNDQKRDSDTASPDSGQKTRSTGFVIAKCVIAGLVFGVFSLFVIRTVLSQNKAKNESVDLQYSTAEIVNSDLNSEKKESAESANDAHVGSEKEENTITKTTEEETHVEITEEKTDITNTTVQETVETIAADDAVKNGNAPFYAIFCYASEEENDSVQYAEELIQRDFDARVYVTTDWENFNPKKYYVVSVGAYETEAAADAKLSEVQSSVCADAYVKYSGSYIGGSSQTR